MSKNRKVFSRFLFSNGKVSKNTKLFKAILIILMILLFILSFYVDWINNHYSKILNVMLVIGVVRIGFLNMKNSKD